MTTQPSTPFRMLRPVLRYHGGKFRLAPMILTVFPEHRVYTEAFGGGASVLMQKQRCYTEIYNDLDGEVVNVFRVLQHPTKAARLEKLLRLTPYSRQEFVLSYLPTRSEVERARRTIIRSFMGFGSDSIGRMKASRAGFNTRISSVMKNGFRWNSNRSGTGPASDWTHYPQHIRAFTERLRGVVIEQRDALTIIEKMDCPDTLHYVDPPYPMSTRKTSKGSSSVQHRYRHEYADPDHKRLAECLRELGGMVVVSSYPSPMYEKCFRGWKRVAWTGGQFCSQNTGPRERTEVVWLNKAAVDAQRQSEFSFR